MLRVSVSLGGGCNSRRSKSSQSLIARSIAQAHDPSLAITAVRTWSDLFIVIDQLVSVENRRLRP